MNKRENEGELMRKKLLASTQIVAGCPEDHPIQKGIAWELAQQQKKKAMDLFTIRFNAPHNSLSNWE